ncbi:hypothetical protein ABZS43_06045, partial [Nocardia sp. NPDC005366]
TGDGNGKGSGNGNGKGNGGSTGSTSPTGGPNAHDPGSTGFGTGGASGAMTGQDLLSLFSEVLQLITSGLPLLEKLGNELAAQLGPGLQALAKAVVDGTMTVKQAIDEASNRIGSEVKRIGDKFSTLGATGPLELSLELFPPPNEEPREQPESPGRAGSHQPGTIEDFTNAMPRTEPIVVPMSPVAPKLTQEGM